MRIIKVGNLEMKGIDNMHVRRIIFKLDLGQISYQGIIGLTRVNQYFFIIKKNIYHLKKT
jgi:hypothetical protein